MSTSGVYTKHSGTVRGRTSGRFETNQTGLKKFKTYLFLFGVEIWQCLEKYSTHQNSIESKTDEVLILGFNVKVVIWYL